MKKNKKCSAPNYKKNGVLKTQKTLKKEIANTKSPKANLKLAIKKETPSGKKAVLAKVLKDCKRK